MASTDDLRPASTLPAQYGAEPASILVVRRDNIGDLLCTTPLLSALRARYPVAFLAVLVSSYNRDVVEGNPDIDAVYVFPKRQQQGNRLFSTLWQRWRLRRALHARRFDVIILANGGWRYGRHLGGRRVIGFIERDNGPDDQPDVVVPVPDSTSVHEVRKLELIGRAIGVPRADGPLTLIPQPARVAAIRARLETAGFDPRIPATGIHISTRRDTQRWPIEHFAALIRALHDQGTRQFLLYWSPGAEDDPMHPGDDRKAAALLDALQGLPVHPCPTTRVAELVAAMSLADCMVCSDGGAMHVAAALHLPILCFFGDSHVAEWHPWGVPCEVLQDASKRVDAIRVETALAGWQRLVEKR
ncbi:MAG: glycosyltransferase family 9 protein [Proteobacteria bacterium]|nr:glycosyltransferase family 9 protein [Pseudomonadota bacterium]HQR04144.1 glycosyltransferase family 9 protein [Rhodocyclaceae bacterium]